MAKKTGKKKKAASKKATGKRVVAEFVKDLLRKNIGIKNKEMVAKVLAYDSTSAFNANQASWYRCEFKKKTLVGMANHRSRKAKSDDGKKTKKKTVKKKAPRRSKTKKVRRKKKAS